MLMKDSQDLQTFTKGVMHVQVHTNVVKWQVHKMIK